jgi:hypothetical protein
MLSSGIFVLYYGDSFLEVLQYQLLHEVSSFLS